MSVPARQPARYEDLLALPRERVGEIVNGVLHSHPRPAPKHIVSASLLGGRLIAPYHSGHGGPGGWWVLDEPECHLGPQVLVPDLATATPADLQRATAALTRAVAKGAGDAAAPERARLGL